MRKNWKDLSAKYRQSLIRKGVTPKQHASGKPLPGTNKYNARTQTNYTRERTSFGKFVDLYYRNLSDDQREGIDRALRNARPDRAVVWMRYMEKMTKAYDEDPKKAERLYKNRPKDMPKELSLYHGAYSS